MPLLLTLALLVFAEIALLVRATGAIGGFNVFGLVVLSAVGGAALSRSLRAGLMQRFQQELGEGRVPATQLVENFLLLFAGMLLVVPGFLTDGLGLILLLPFARRPLAEKLRARFATGPRGGIFTQFGAGSVPGFPPGSLGGQPPSADPENGGETARAPDGTPIRDIPVVQHPVPKPERLNEGSDKSA